MKRGIATGPRLRAPTRDHMETIFDALDFATAWDDYNPAAAVFVLLRDCWPTDGAQGQLGATHRQLHYIGTLAGMSAAELAEFTDYADELELSSHQGGHLIGRLLEIKEAGGAA